MISMGATRMLYDTNDKFCVLYLMIGKIMMGVTRFNERKIQGENTRRTITLMFAL